MVDVERWSGVPLGRPLTGHGGAVVSVAWAVLESQPVLAIGSGDGSVRLWDLRDPAAPVPLGQPLPGHTNTVWSVAWAVLEGRPVLATGSDDNSVRLWDLRDPAAPVLLGQPLTGHTYVVWSVAWWVLEGRPVLAIGGGDGSVRLWDLRDPAAPVPLGQPLTGHTSEVRSVAWAVVEGRPVLATGGYDGSVRLWDLRDPAAPVLLGQPLTGHTDSAWSVVWGVLEGRPVLAIGGGDGSVRLWDLRDPAAPVPLGQPLTGHNGEVRSVAWAVLEGRPVLATGIYDSVRLWDLRDPATPVPLGQPLTGHTNTVRSMAWTVLEGRPVLATGSDDGSVRLWEVVEDRPVARLPSYQSDATSWADDLSRDEEARALAELVTARSARPPLAVGLFGDWGEGKSHFLELMQQQVRATARPGNLLAHHAVRQVRFNAWHYAETDLWASLVAELFAQLAAPPDQDSATAQRQLSRLSADLVAQRELPQRLRAARQRHDKLKAALSQRRGPRWTALSPEQQREWTAVAGEVQEPGQLYGQLRGGVRVLRGTVGAGWALLRSNPRRMAGGVLVSVLCLTLVSAGALWGPPLWARLVGALPALAGAGVLGQRLWRFKKEGDPLRKRLLGVTQVWRDRLQTAADIAAGEVAALERELQNLTAAGQLAGLVTERAASGDYRSHLGLMTQIREDFHRMAALLTSHGSSTTGHDTSTTGRDGSAAHAGPEDAAGDPLPSIDRIIIYIDDLDRCPPARVVQMLEAVHLLLAVDLFVVVVAIDPRWLLRAIAAHYRDILHTPAVDTPGTAADPVDPDDEELWASTPAQYLEKVFQVVLTLPALDTTGYQSMLRSLVRTRIDQSTPPPTTTTAPGGAATPVATSSVPPQALADSLGQGVTLPAPRVIERVDPLTLDPDEIALMDLLGPPLLVATPRAVKRLANSYGLLTALRRTQRAADLTEQPATAPTGTPYHPYRAGLVLLSALIAYPQLGPALCLHLHRTSRTDPQQTWERFRTDLIPRPNPADGHWSNPADPTMTPVQAQQWTSLLTALHHVTDHAASAALPLPDLLGPWHQWVAPVARLSFPAGRIVTLLDR